MKNTKFIAILMVVLILVSSSGSSFVFAAGETETQAYNLGVTNGKADAFGKDTIKDMPSDQDIEAYYTGDNKEKYLEGYKLGYTTAVTDQLNAYNEGYNLAGIHAEYYSIIFDDITIMGMHGGEYKEMFLRGYIQGFKVAKATLGMKLGKLVGEFYGARDFMRGIPSDWVKAIPSDGELIIRYNLNMETDGYKAKFLEDFKFEFEIAYKDGYEKANLDPNIASKEAGNIDGGSVGAVLGDLQGKKDFENQLTSYFKRYMPSETKITQDYELDKVNATYKHAFMTSFKIAYELNYDRAYREANLEDKKGKTYRQGYDEGIKFGKSTGEWHYNNGKLVPVENVRLSNEQVKINYASQLSMIDPIYKDDFVEGFQSGFTIGYESIDVLMTERLDGFNKGYNDGKVLAAENNANKKFLDFSQVELSPYQIMGNNYDYLKDKGTDFINNFVIGYQEGYEKGYNEIIKKSDAEGSKDGAAVGTVLGEMFGKQDFENGKPSNFLLVMPTDADIKEYYKLGNINNIAYENSFIASFKIAFESSYDRAYKEANLDDKQAFNQGYILGVEYGKTKGLENLIDGKLLPIEKVRLTSAQIKAWYPSKLAGRSPIYVDEFIKGYQSGFTFGYESISTSVSETLDGYNKGYEYGKQLAGENNAIRKFTSYSDLAILTSEQIMRSNYDYLKDKGASFIDNFVEGYQEGYEKGYKEIIKESASAGTEYGTIAGTILGEALGKKDSEDKKENNPTLAMPSYTEIVQKYELDKFNDEAYKDAFITSFRIAFKAGYEKAYVEVVEEGDAEGSRDGTAAGASLGQAFGIKDFKDKKASDFSVVMPDDSKIAIDYELDKINNPAYKAAFISSFKIAFELSYDKAYKEANMDDKDGQGYKLGYTLGSEYGRVKGEEEISKGKTLIPVDQVRLSTTEIKAKHATDLAGKDNIFIDDFIKGYQDGFKFGYDSSNISIIEEADGYSKGYTDGRSLAAENNKNENYLPYDKVAMTDYQVMGKNYTYLKDKGTDFIANFVRGYQEGFEKGYKEVIKVVEEEEVDKTAISSNFGASLGLLYGEIEGIKDYERGVKPDWYRALPRESEIISRFNLSKLPRTERDEFLDKFTLNFQIGYEKAYYNANFGLVRDNLNAGKIDGALFGASLGKINGTRDYFEKRNSDYNRDMPNDREIRADYSLRRDDELYESSFVSSFMKAYQEAYIKAFRDASKNDVIRDGENSEQNGLEVGTKMGEMQAVSDYLQQKTNDWKRSIPDERTIISDYNLTLLSDKYRSGFISAFYDGYSKGYNDRFKEFAQGNAVNKTNSELIPLKGGSLNSLDNAFNLNIEAGTYYHPVHLTLNTMYNYNSLFPSSFIKASDSYAVNILNTSQNVDNKKLIEVQFEYYGDKIRGGIYKFVGNKWVYLPTKIENGYMTTLVTPAQINGTYSAFVNTNIVIFPDARGHWAKDEINALIRRSIISGYSDNTFKPDKNISRAEFLTLLSRTYDWNMYYYSGNATAFKDYASFGSNSNIINYATSMGYISGYPDGTFKPNNPISYREVEIIMSRIAYGADSRWSTYATKMQYEKKVKSASLTNMNNKITRAEVVYMLYNANQGKY